MNQYLREALEKININTSGNWHRAINYNKGIIMMSNQEELTTDDLLFSNWPESAEKRGVEVSISPNFSNTFYKMGE